MIDSRLIMLEGLPGTGKSTNSHFLQMQLERNGHPVKWIHEVARPNPTQRVSESCFTHEEYLLFVKTYPQARDVLHHVAAFHHRTVGFDMLEIEWNYRSAIGDTVYKALQEYDSWIVKTEMRAEYMMDKWLSFAEKALLDKDCIYILDSSIFQFQLWGFLLENAPYKELESYIHRLIALVKPLNPALIYLYRENVEHTIGFLEKKRGVQSLEGIWQRDHPQPYYQDKPKGAEGFKHFLRDYAAIAARLYEAIDCKKISIDLSGDIWEQYEEQMLSFLCIQRKPAFDAVAPRGIYRNEALGLTIKIDDLTMQEPNGHIRTLTPKSENEFYVECLPTILRFDESKQLVISAGQICEQWTTLGTVYRLLDHV